MVPEVFGRITVVRSQPGPEHRKKELDLLARDVVWKAFRARINRSLIETDGRPDLHAALMDAFDQYSEIRDAIREDCQP